MAQTKKYIYLFEEGGKELVDLLGGKGAGLAEMTKIGLNVPPGFTITTEACIDFLRDGNFPKGMMEQTMDALHMIEEKVSRKFGNPENPLLVSVRSGAPVSMPGMMDTVLNVGLNDETVKGLAFMTDNERFALDAYRRLIQMFGEIVYGLPHEEFRGLIEKVKREKGYDEDKFTTSDITEIIKGENEIYRKHKKSFPQDPQEQLVESIKAVFNSWNSRRAKTYREINHIPENMGTAVSIVTMVFGNMGSDSATGVAFTRDPNTGEKRIFAEYLTNAQGEDVVAGIRTPKYIDDMKMEMPQAYSDLIRMCDILEHHYRDMQDIEFTIERGKLYMLQTRTGKRSAKAAIRIAVEMYEEGIISEEEAIMRVTPEIFDRILHPQVKTNGKETPLGKGLAASPGAAIGSIVFSSERAIELGKSKKMILVRPETTADDVRGMAVCEGFLTQKGGMTSHAAVVARAMGKPAVVGVETMHVDTTNNTLTINGKTLHEGDVVTIDGTSGLFYLGELPVEKPEIDKFSKKLLELADKNRKLGVRANANTPEEAHLARENGAEGIGLARTERMFLGNERIPIMRSMIMSESKEERQKYLEQLLPMQISDFVEFFKTMEGYPVIIRLLDPPLHEFLPDKETILNKIYEIKSGKNGSDELQYYEKLLKTVRDLEEFNPMLGFRGCRVGLVYPEIYDMQVRAIMEAAVRVQKEGRRIMPEIMIPLVGHHNELKILMERLEKTAKSVKDSDQVDYKFGTMIEIPRACVTADKIAKYADFFSFGTNDLTQMTFGYSRDDAEGKFMFFYLENGILEKDPFSSVDEDGVGELMRMAVEKGRKSNEKLEVGICGEQGGDPDTIYFCHKIGLDYVSASPYRIPIARLAAARANISEMKPELASTYRY
ncbi:pyruvate orthophosphate dikinase [Thermoplasma volcanium GSS1]|uniref:pyruvate, phosphate dikinase n=1 Tax=Thermoplasma volcanium (strain ATCC 51530 / DSM 4299 / JCM 9571 / NBRC 15438 / GSS1) TaxID=273116 RepID=Q97A04_THEVO|nr:pyruvate, phosphate dikinase [Thermoplasma volcanium]BAB60148.1 pyruvate orthophosphate dikinase [Thermoplasma volcanium GSS1]